MTHVNEGGLTPEQFVARFAEDPPEPSVQPLTARRKNPPPPRGMKATGGLDIQDHLAQLANEGVWADIRSDLSASDGLAVYMPGDHHEWAFQVHLGKGPAKARTGKWDVYVVVRVERKSGVTTGTAFTAGIWDTASTADLGSLSVSVADAATEYRAYRLGTVESKPDRYIWVAPAANPGVSGVWVDRVWLVRAP